MFKLTTAGIVALSTLTFANCVDQEFVEDAMLESLALEDEALDMVDDADMEQTMYPPPEVDEENPASIKHPENPLYDLEEANILIRGSDTGLLDLKFFENYILKPDKTNVRFKQSWFLGFFDGECTTDKCKDAEDNFEQLFLIWLGETMDKKGLNYEEEESWLKADDNTSLETFKIAKVNCSQYKEEICDRVLPSSESKDLPKFVIINGEKAYEWNIPLNYWEIDPYIEDQKFLEDSTVKVHYLKNFGMTTEEI